MQINNLSKENTNLKSEKIGLSNQIKLAKTETKSTNFICETLKKQLKNSNSEI